MGRLHKSKNIELLLETYSELTGKMDNIKLVLAGPNEMGRIIFDKIDRLKLREKVLITGHIPEREKIGSFIDSDVFVTPKFYGFPITFAESCVCGCPIITTNGGDHLNWINNRVGFVVNPNKNDMEKAIIKILNEKETRHRFSSEAQLLAKDTFNWLKITDKLENIYLDVVTSNP